jgi:hypothetical protein
MRCPEKCRDGYHHSSGDGWDEWDECRCCNPKGDNETGTVTKLRLAAFRKEEAAQVAHADAVIAEWTAEMSKPCPKCGVPKIDHANRDGEPCQSIDEANREYRAAKAARDDLQKSA